MKWEETMDSETRAFIQTMKEDIDEIKKDVKALAECVASLKAWRGWMMGALAGFGALGGIGGVLAIMQALK